MTKIYPLGDDNGFIELLGHFGDDLDVVNAARVSYNRSSTDFGDRDAKLLAYLIDPASGSQHTSPLRGVVFKFRVKCPLYIARQWHKHMVASSYIDEQRQWNEVSRRYTAINEEDFYTPEVFRGQHPTNRQQSGEPIEEQRHANLLWETACDNAWKTYSELLKLGVSREDARGILPTCQYTTFIWTVGLQAALLFLDLRSGHGAQLAITLYADALRTLIAPIVPNTVFLWERRRDTIEEALSLLRATRQAEQTEHPST